MKRVRTILLLEFWIPVVVSLLLVALYESDVLLAGGYATAKSAEFIIETVLVFVVIGFIPLALKLFRFAKIRARLEADPEGALLRWGSLRILMLALPMLLNTLLYYLFMRPGFGYLAIVLFLSLFFVYPSVTRCKDETVSHHSQL